MPALPSAGPGLNGQTRRAIDALTAGRLNSCNVADLPTTGIAPGTVYFALDGLKEGETTGNGTGCPCYFDGTGWFRYSDDTAVSD